MTMSSQNIDSLWEKELSLAKKLRESLDRKGKETNPEKSAFIFYHLGLLYEERSKQDNSINKKLNLIRSVALLNAAVTRQPGNKQFKQSLKVFCSDLLKTANANVLDADLLRIAENAKEMAENMRKEAKQKLQLLRRIPYEITYNEQKKLEMEKVSSIKIIQTQITEQYKDMMKFLSRECEKIMGHSPCKYSIVGMGSLARSEITPYSDFEHIILLEEGVQEKENYFEMLEYFRWFSVIFQTIIINLEETIIPNLAIPSFKHVAKPGEKGFFDAYTKRGISFDGLMPYACHFPLGRMEKTIKKQFTTEFIKPVSQMLKFFEMDEDLKNGYNIPNVLMNICQVYGDEQIYQQFSDGVKHVLQSNKPSHHQRVMQQLNEDLKNFDAFKSLNALHVNSKYDIKRLVYRSTTLFVAALGMLNSIHDGPSFAIIDQLNNKDIIDDKTAHLLSYAIAVSCEVRLKVYLEKDCQDDAAGDEQLHKWNSNKVYANLVETVGEKSMVDYFGIAYNLQNVLRTEDDLSNLKVTINLKPVDKFRMLYMLQLRDRVICEWESYSQVQLASTLSEDELWLQVFVAHAYSLSGQCDKAFHMFQGLEERDIYNPELKWHVMYYKVWCLFNLDRFQETLQFIGRVKPEVLNLNISDSRKYDLRSGLAVMSGWCHFNLEEYQLAIDQFVDSSVHATRADQRDLPMKEMRRATCFLVIGQCLYKLGDYDAAISEAMKALIHGLQHNAPVNEKCSCYNLLGVCHLDKGEYKEALKYFKAEVALMFQIVPQEKRGSDKDIKACISNMLVCQEKLK
ncbi:unnamed protein product [Clavelina lepadiformis]|uniref:Protein-PII uridylyltransferase N-terminal domain-containing protein n=1 Tax=Clavelina lepadiformis TaxID=159417 RepID=A0ABP0G1V7_CLALP